ncbi:MAG: DUF5947 family protein [Chloroflexota bacterium]|nr:DUF5947 family protein [Chloroflexota bacterium]
MDNRQSEIVNRKSLAILRQFVRPRVVLERCELCSADLAHQHQHLIDPTNRQMVCCCDACAILFSDEGKRYRRVPRRARVLTDFQITDAQWDSLLIPIGMAFFYQSTAVEKVIALYPSPAGATESLLELEAWTNLVRDNPILAQFEPDVEALLVNRVGTARDYYRVPIDKCYQLVGLIRMHWRGLSGGSEAWDAIGQFFDKLKAS